MRLAIPPDAKIGLGIFVKTPGYSPIKTRLAAAIGTQAAEAFHRMAATAVAEIAVDSALAHARVAVYWAVAEADAIDAPVWGALPCLAQGDGDLGLRMRTVYESLRARHGAAVLIGADSPQLCRADLQGAFSALATRQTVIGPSEDGGFWLFGGRAHVPDAAWLRTPWSQPQTRAHFVAALGTAPHTLRTLRDVDTVEDLNALREALAALPVPSPAQSALATWLAAGARAAALDAHDGLSHERLAQ